MNEGFIKLSRGYFQHPFWKEKRTFDRAGAWLDLLQSAAFAPHKKMVLGHMLEIERGCLVASVRRLCERWKWSNNKVCLFLDLLEGEQMISRETRRGCTVISVCNYDKYNTPENAKATPTRRGCDADATPTRQIEEGKELKAEREHARELPSESEVKEFAKTIGIAEWKALDWFNEMESCGWLDYQKRPVMKWKPLLVRVKAKWEADGRPTGPTAARGINGSRRTEADRDRENTGLDEGIKLKRL